MTLRFTLNGREVEHELPGRMTLLALLREVFLLTGTKKGCGTGDCGSCRVLVNGRAVPSCTLPAAKVQGASVVTIEGVRGEDGGLHPLQKAFIEAGAVQCGFCTPGMIIQGLDLLSLTPRPDEKTIREHFKNNLCRCTGYVKIVKAVQMAAEQNHLK